MFVKNFLTSGDFLTVVPVGYPMTIQYDVNGTIERVYKYWGDNRVLLDKEVLHKMMKTNLVPRSVSLKGGSTLVAGVLYTNQKFVQSGDLPDCIMDDLMKAYLEDSGSFNFFAGCVESHSTVFRGAVPIRQWLTFAGFNVLPGFVIPHNINEADFSKLVHDAKFPFTYPLISDYILFKGGLPEYHNVGLNVNIVRRVDSKVNQFGYILSEVEFTDDSTASFNYSDLIQLKLAPEVVLVRHAEGRPIYSYNNKNVVVSNTLSCPFCGKLIKVPTQGRVRCDDMNCNSRLYYSTRKLLEILNVPVPLTYGNYITYSTEVGQAYQILDILDAPDYSEVEVSATIPNVLFAMIPPELNVSVDSIVAFCNRCNNKISTVQYYLDNTDRIASDLGVHDDSISSMIKLIEEYPSWVLDVDAALHHERIHIVDTGKKFDGAPIFRNRTILITGDFNHGNSSEITAILSSYSAEVVTSISDSVDCIVVGDRKENINGHIIQQAQKQGIPIFTESQFFSQYDIDADMAQNL